MAQELSLTIPFETLAAAVATNPLLLSYGVTPNVVPIVGATGVPTAVTLTLGVSNGLQDDVVCTAIGFTLPPGLTSNPGSVTQPIALPGTAWTISGDGQGNFTAQPAGGQPVILSPGDNLAFQLPNVQITAAVAGLCVIGVSELSDPTPAPAGPTNRQGGVNVMPTPSTLAITSFYATPLSLPTPTWQLAWTTVGADHCTLSWDGQTQTMSAAQFNVTPTATTTYTLTAVSGNDSVAQQFTVFVPNVQIAMTVSAPQGNYGDTITLSWDVRHATTCTLTTAIQAPSGPSGATTPIPTSGQQAFKLAGNTTFTINATGLAGPPDSRQLAVAAHDPAAVVSIQAVPASTGRGMLVSINWKAQCNPEDLCKLGEQVVPPVGSMHVVPSQTSVYTLTCQTLDSSYMAQVVVPINDLDLAPLGWDQGSRTLTLVASGAAHGKIVMTADVPHGSWQGEMDFPLNGGVNEAVPIHNLMGYKLPFPPFWATQSIVATVFDGQGDTKSQSLTIAPYPY